VIAWKFGIVSACTLGVSAGAAAAAGLCGADAVLFECRLPPQTVAVCMIAATAAHPAFAQYRAGRPGHLTAIFPAAPVTGGAIAFSTTGFAGGGENHLSFVRGHDTYLLYDSTRRTGFTTTNDPEFSAGLTIIRAGKAVSSRKCSDDASIRALAYKALPRVPFAARPGH
jgi:hypothetical protein